MKEITQKLYLYKVISHNNGKSYLKQFWKENTSCIFRFHSVSFPLSCTQRYQRSQCVLEK
jgi:hypothetical protein